jgi:transposase
MGARTALNKTYKIISKSKLAKKLGVTYQTIDRWIDCNELPCTEYNKKTRYARNIEIITEGKVTVEDLLGWRPPHQIESLD